MKPVIYAAILFLVISLLFPGNGLAQEAIPFDDAHWQFSENPKIPLPKEHVLGTYLGQPSVRLRNTTATLSGMTFTNGIIEYDMAHEGGRGFVYLRFRLQDEANHESFYVRLHQSGNPDATQYMPVFNDKESWQLYPGEGFTAAAGLPSGQWIHVKLVIVEGQMEVYINNMDKPALFVPELKRAVGPGKISLASMGDPAYFANFRFTTQPQPTIRSVAKPAISSDPGAILSWQVSNSFPERVIRAGDQLAPTYQTGYRWQSVKTEPSGLLNLAKGLVWSDTVNTAFVRVQIYSNRKQAKPLQLGFSDRARVYLNRQLLYMGHDEFLSRDYRFLGSLGLYDTIYLPLEKGNNELLIAITDEFGGWGIKALLTNRQGIRLLPTP